MKKSTLVTLPCLLATLLTADLARGDFLLYEPKPAAGDQVPASPDQGVLVRTVTVKRGDTLANIARKHIGRAGWFSQVLLFNSIKNPDLIYVGDKLLVPVPPGRAAVGKAKAASVRKHAGGQKRHGARRAVVRRLGAAKPEASRLRPATPDEQGRYQQARRSYLDGNYQQSLDLFTSFLREYPRSTLSADAALYRADSLLRLAGE